MENEIPENLKGLARELDALAGAGSEDFDFDGLPDLAGTDFEPLAEIGRGGMGIVYEARQKSLDRTVALKVLAPHFAKDGDFRARFLAESRVVARLNHPNIVDVYAAGVKGNVYYFAMELNRGRCAAERKFQSLEEVAKFGITVADALAYAHSLGVIHRDVKPANVFINEAGLVKLGDFGLACMSGEVADSAGTAKYLAPELRAGKAASFASDQYSLGATLLELAAPFIAGKRRDDFVKILDKATRNAAAERYDSVAELALDLRRYLSHEPIVAAVPTLAHRLRLWSRRNPAACGGTAAAAFLLAGLVASLVYGYLNTRRALADADSARAAAELALEQVETEAAQTALALAGSVGTLDHSGEGMRANEIARAIETAEKLAGRFPDNKDIQSAVGRLRYAKAAHERFRIRRQHRADSMPGEL